MIVPIIALLESQKPSPQRRKGHQRRENRARGGALSIMEPSHIVIPAKAGIQRHACQLDFGLRRNDVF
jgi:hypothetical protein